MYVIIFQDYPKEGQKENYIAQWQKGSDVIQTYPGAKGTKIFHKAGDPKALIRIAAWESKEARKAAMAAIERERQDAQEILHKHESCLDQSRSSVLGELELIAESNPPSSY